MLIRPVVEIPQRVARVHLVNKKEESNAVLPYILSI